jgi:hypothetical protein
MTEQKGLTPIGNTKREDSRRVFALMAAPTTLLPSTTTEAMREKRLSKDRTNFGMEVSSQSPHFSRFVNAPVNTLPRRDLVCCRKDLQWLCDVEHLHRGKGEYFDKPRSNWWKPRGIGHQLQTAAFSLTTWRIAR